MNNIKDSKTVRQKVFNGDFFLTNEGYDVVVVEYTNSYNVLVEILDGFGYRCKVEAKQLKLGTIKNPYHKSILGVGYLGVGKYRCSNKGILTREYIAWASAMNRCYSEKYQNKFPKYKDCTVCEEWHNFQNFAEWYTRQVGYDYGYDLDKDLLVMGNRVYSPKTCVIIPKEINNFLLLRKGDRGKYPLGVSFCKAKKQYTAYCSEKSSRNLIGYYNTPVEAHKAYKERKENLAKLLADKWEDFVDSKVTTALLNFKITNDM